MLKKSIANEASWRGGAEDELKKSPAHRRCSNLPNTLEFRAHFNSTKLCAAVAAIPHPTLETVSQCFKGFAAVVCMPKSAQFSLYDRLKSSMRMTGGARKI